MPGLLTRRPARNGGVASVSPCLRGEKRAKGDSSVLTIDGSFGEGGGQILRTSLALSMVTGTAFRIDNIRARRAKGGLLRQHVTAVHAAAEMSGAQVEGAELR